MGGQQVLSFKCGDGSFVDALSHEYSTNEIMFLMRHSVRPLIVNFELPGKLRQRRKSSRKRRSNSHKRDNAERRLLAISNGYWKNSDRYLGCKVVALKDSPLREFNEGDKGIVTKTKGNKLIISFHYDAKGLTSAKTIELPYYDPVLIDILPDPDHRANILNSSWGSNCIHIPASELDSYRKSNSRKDRSPTLNRKYSLSRTLSDNSSEDADCGDSDLENNIQKENLQIDNTYPPASIHAARRWSLPINRKKTPTPSVNSNYLFHTKKRSTRRQFLQRMRGDSPKSKPSAT